MRNGLVAAACAVCFFLFACGGHSGGGSASTGPTDAGTGTPAPDAGTFANAGTATIEWAPQTTYVDEAHLGALVAADESAQTYTFDTAQASAANLDLSAGRVLVIHRKALRKITSVQTSGSTTIVSTDDAALTDAMQNAEIDLAEPITFTDEHMAPQALVHDGPQSALAPAAATGSKFKYSFKLSNYDAEMDLTTKGDKSDVELTISKGPVKFTASGELEGSISRHHVSIKGGKLTGYSSKNDGLKGSFKLNITAAGGGSDNLNLKPSITFLEIPDFIGPIPVVIKMSIQVVVKLVMPVDASSQVEASFTFDSSSGVTYDGTNFTFDVGPAKVDTAKGITQTGASSAAGINYGFNFPIYELSIFGGVAGVSVKPGFLIGGSFTPFFPPCQTADADFLVSAGGSLSVLSAVKLEYTKTLFEQKTSLLRTAQCPPP
jgi:hypothetical protein